MRQPSATRRRGDRLLESIYDATIEIIRDEGYSNLTFLRVARLARTGRAVLYRRWATPFDLVRDLMVYRSAQALGGDLIDMVKDTGSLRGDLLYVMEMYHTLFIGVGPEVVSAMWFEQSQNNSRIPSIRDDIGLRNITLMQKLIGFAEQRGERIKPLSTIALTLPFDLLRLNILWERQVPDEATREKLVDEILLPVYLDDSPAEPGPTPE